MQLTRLDRWLKETFVYEIQVYTLRAAEIFPRKVRHLELPEKPGRRFKHLYTTSDPQAAEKLLISLKEENQMFTTKVIDKDAWYVQFIAPEGKSPTWYVVSAFLLMALATPVVIWVRSLLSQSGIYPEREGSIRDSKGIMPALCFRLTETASPRIVPSSDDSYETRLVCVHGKHLSQPDG